MKFLNYGSRRRKWARLQLALVGSALGTLLAAGLGYLLGEASLIAGSERRPVAHGLRRIGGVAGDTLARVSYDLQFLLRGRLVVDEARIVYFDEGSVKALRQTMGVWDRSLHAKLVRRLTQQGARAVLFDFVFEDAWPDPAVDEDFAAAMRENGHVFIGAALEVDAGVGAVQQRTLPPTPVLRRAAAGWGLLAFRPVDPDYAVRKIYAGMETIPTATWVAAQKLGSDLPDSPAVRAAPRWLNYYGPADSIDNISYDRALDPALTPKDFFRDRIVVVGGRSTLGELRLGKDDFRNPYSVIGSEFSKGPEVHLTTLLNLIHGEWLSRAAPLHEISFIVFFGICLGGSLPWLKPHLAAVAAFIALVAVISVAGWLFTERHIWFAWSIPAFVQTPVALVWAVGARYFIEERKRNALRNAFAHYLSPQMADRIANADFDLSLGGTVVEATVMFTDLENFTPLSEKLEKPELISEVLTTYFTQTTGHILENDGTIIKYLGDSVQAVWGAPLPDEDHARKAVLAAWRLHEASIMEVQGHPLRTRVGVNTGLMLSGNLGSAQRFDYAVTGDAVNFGSRLEGMNKQLGTSVLISDSVKARIGEAFATRCVGEFRVVGKKVPRVIYELLGAVPASAEEQRWIDAFERGLAEFRARDLDGAEAAMRATITARGTDGPSSFYLERIAELRAKGLPADWTGIVELTAK